MGPCTSVNKVSSSTYQNQNGFNSSRSTEHEKNLIQGLNMRKTETYSKSNTLRSIEIQQSSIRETRHKAGECAYYKALSDSTQKIDDSDLKELKDKVEICLAWKNLFDSQAEYKVRVFLCNQKSNNNIFETIGETEKASPDKNKITFNKTFYITYYFETHQFLKFELFKNGKSKTLTECLAKIIQSRNQTCEIPDASVDEEDFEAVLEVNILQKINNKSMSYLTLKFSMNEKYNMFYFIESNKNQKDKRIVYKSREFQSEKSKVLSESLNIPTEALITNEGSNILITFCDSKTKQYLGQYMFFIDKNNAISLAKKPIKTSSVGEKGVMSFDLDYKEQNRMHFRNYLSEGLDINLIIAIDYTYSNGLHTNPESNHYLAHGKLNDYENAILSCGNIVAQYDTDKLYPVYGFGGKVNNQSEVSHCFNINNKDDPNIEQIQNIIPIYKASFQNVVLSGPTHFSPVIKKVYDQIQEEKNAVPSKYYILMILTDGLINDMNEVRDLLVEASAWPLSIIIVGIGDGDFSNMNELDGNDVPLVNQQGVQWQRDLVRFVHFNRFKNRNNPSELNQPLAKEVLKEVPSQVEEYFRLAKTRFIGKNDNNMISRPNK